MLVVDDRVHVLTTISNTRATFAYNSFCDNLRLQCQYHVMNSGVARVSGARGQT